MELRRLIPSEFTEDMIVTGAGLLLGLLKLHLEYLAVFFLIGVSAIDLVGRRATMREAVNGLIVAGAGLEVNRFYIIRV